MRYRIRKVIYFFGITALVIDFIVNRLKLPHSVLLVYDILFILFYIIILVIEKPNIKLDFISKLIVFWLIISFSIGILYNGIFLSFLFILDNFKFLLLFILVKDIIPISSKSILKIILVVALLQIPFGLIQKYIFMSTFDQSSGFLSDIPAIPMINYFGIIFPLFLYNIYLKKNRIRNIIYIVSFLFLCLISSTRIGYILFIFSVLSFIIFQLTLRKKSKRILLITPLVLLMLYFVIEKRNLIFQELSFLSPRIVQNIELLSSVYSMYAYASGITGVGIIKRLENYPFFLNETKNSLSERLFGYGAGARSIRFDGSLVGYLRLKYKNYLSGNAVANASILYTSGFLGLFIYMTILYKLTLSGYKYRYINDKYALILFNAGIFFAGISFYGSVFNENSISFLFFLILLLNYNMLTEKKQKILTNIT